MSTFYYYIPGDKSVSKERLDEIGLGKVIDKPISRGCQSATPDEGRGCVVVNDGDVMPVMDMPNQTWRATPSGDMDSPPYWIGYASSDPPGPESLVRGSVLRGVDMKLEGGQVWHIPQIRNWHDSQRDIPAVFSTRLPQMVDFADDGAAVPTGVIPRYTNIWEESLDLHSRLYSAASQSGEAGLSDSEVFEFASKVIGLNYRVSLFELSILRAMSTDDCIAIVRTALDCDGYEDALKNFMDRLTPEGTDTPSGSDRSTTDTQAITGQQ